MLFSSALFIFYFLPLLLVVYYLAPRSARNLVLLAGSLFFYAWGAPQFIWLLLAFLGLNFFLVRQMMAADFPQARRKSLLQFSIFLHLALLGYFKYANFFVENIERLWFSSRETGSNWVEVALPLGISFFTFQSISYVVDVYRREKAPIRLFTDYLLYILCFPQLIAGPIVRFTEIADQLPARQRPSGTDDLLHGFHRFSLGLAKKILIADLLAGEVIRIFALAPGELTTSLAWIGATTYGFQLYFDFSGYTDMAIGLGRMFGFRFPENFRYPFLASSVSDYWRRWHLTFSRWIRDYIYFPLGGSRVPTARLYLNLILVFLLSGLWHGADWTFVIWGLSHGLLLIIERNFRNRSWSLPFIFSFPLTFLFLTFVRALFRSPDLQTGWAFMRGMLNWSEINDLFSVLTAFGPEFLTVYTLAALLSFSPLIPAVRNLADRLYHEATSPRHVSFRFLLSLSLFVLSAIFMVSADFSPFIYFRF